MAEHLAAAETISTEALKKAEEFVELEIGRTNRFAGWIGWAVTALAVAMTLFHLYAAKEIVSAQVLRPVHVGFVLVLSFLLFPILPPSPEAMGHRAGRVGPLRHLVHDLGRRRSDGSQHAAQSDRHPDGRAVHRAGAGSNAAHHRLDHSVRQPVLHRLCALRPLSAAALDTPGLRCRPAGPEIP